MRETIETGWVSTRVRLITEFEEKLAYTCMNKHGSIYPIRYSRRYFIGKT